MAGIALLNYVFNGGVLSELMRARPDQEKYQAGCFVLDNMVSMAQGPATRRPGFMYLGNAEDQDMDNPVRVMPFVFAATESRVFEFGVGYIHFWADDALLTVDASDTEAWATATDYAVDDYKVESSLVYRCIQAHTSAAIDQPGSGANWETYWVQDATVHVTTEFTAADIPDLWTAQSADVTYIASRQHPPFKLSRYADHDWRLEEINFIPETEIPGNVAVANTTTVSSDGSTTYKYVITAIDNTTGEESLPGDVVSVTCDILNKTDGNYNDITWDANTVEPLEYRVYKYDAGVYGYIGTVDGSEASPSFRDDNINSDEEDTPPSAENPFDSEDNYPGIVFFWQQRLGWASSNNYPFTVWLSPSAQFESLAAGSPPADDDAIEATLATARANRIQWVAPDRTLVIGTSGNEWIMGGTDGEVLTPSEVRFNLQSSMGSEPVPALSTGGGLLFVQRGGDVVREFTYSYDNDQYLSPDASIISSHLLDGKTIVDWRFQLNPYSVVWAVLDDGSLVGVTYVREHKVVAWHSHSTDGFIEDICCVPGQGYDPVWAVIRRNINGTERRFIERMDNFFVRQSDPADAFFVDCGVKYDGAETDTLTDIAPHLVGETVKVWADGAEQAEKVVQAGGTVVLDTAASKVSLGLEFVSDLVPARPEVLAAGGTTMAHVMKVNKAMLRLYRSMGVWAGANENELEEVIMHDAFDPLDPALVTENVEVVVDTGWTDEWEFLIRAKGPVPMTVLACVYDVEVGETL